MDGRFIKTLPIHSSQKVAVETEEYVEVTLRLKITNDFVMALLSRSSSVEILAPQSLKDRMNAIWAAAYTRQPGRCASLSKTANRPIHPLKS